MRTEITPVTPEIYRFRFTPDVSMERARDLVAHAILLAEHIHGPARVRLDCGYFADDRKRCLVVDARTKAGQSVAVFYTQLLLNEFGLTAFDVERVPKDDGFTRRGVLGRVGSWLSDRCRGAVRCLTGARFAARRSGSASD
jgi:hypothetical protein